MHGSLHGSTRCQIDRTESRSIPCNSGSIESTVGSFDTLRTPTVDEPFMTTPCSFTVQAQMTHMSCGLVIRGSEWDLDSKLHMRSAGGLILTWSQ